MEDRNFEYLSEQLIKVGFDAALVNKLGKEMQKGLPNFNLIHQTKFGKDQGAAVLYFRKPVNSEIYYFNKYELSTTLMNKGQILKQSFPVNKDTVTLNEGYNLLSGRSVLKNFTKQDGQSYQAWMQLDFRETTPTGNFAVKQFHENYGYNLRESLEKHPIKELADPHEKERLISSLSSGNLERATQVKDKGIEVEMYVEANPQFKTVNLYDFKMQRIHQGKDVKQSSKMDPSVNEKVSNDGTNRKHTQKRTGGM